MNGEAKLYFDALEGNMRRFYEGNYDYYPNSAGEGILLKMKGSY